MENKNWHSEKSAADLLNPLAMPAREISPLLSFKEMVCDACIDSNMTTGSLLGDNDNALKWNEN